MAYANRLLSQIDRALSPMRFTSPVTVETAAGSASLTAGTGAPATLADIPDILRRLGRVMDGAERGAVATVTLADADDLVIAAPGGPFDDRATTPPPAYAESAVSPAINGDPVPAGGDVRPSSRALYVGQAGDVEVTMIGGDVVVFRSVPAGSILPIRAVAIGADTTATDLIALR